jgi:hypothetical protein
MAAGFDFVQYCVWQRLGHVAADCRRHGWIIGALKQQCWRWHLGQHCAIIGLKDRARQDCCVVPNPCASIIVCEPAPVTVTR